MMCRICGYDLNKVESKHCNSCGCCGKCSKSQNANMVQCPNCGHINYVEDNKKYGYYQMPEKRLWNFLLFYFKCENKSHKLTPKQLKILQKAHDLKYSKTMFKEYFYKMKGEYLWKNKQSVLCASACLLVQA